MKKVLFLMLSAMFLISCSQTTPKDKSSVAKAQIEQVKPVKDGVFIHITEGYNDPHRVLMPLKMAVLMSNDYDVLVYMDIHAVELAVKGAKDLKYADFESFRTYIKRLVKQGVGVYACPTCLKIAGYQPSDLIEGIQVAQKDKFFNFTKGRIITLDY